MNLKQKTVAAAFFVDDLTFNWPFVQIALAVSGHLGVQSRVGQRPLCRSQTDTSATSLLRNRSAPNMS